MALEGAQMKLQCAYVIVLYRAVIRAAVTLNPFNGDMIFYLLHVMSEALFI